MRTPTTIADHPLHPMLIVLPQGMWTLSFVCMLVALASSNPEWIVAARYAAGGGVIGAILAAIPGSIDLFSMRDNRVKRIGLTHMTLNLIGVVLWIVIWILLQPVANLGWAFLLSLIAVAILFYAGWLGGTMVHRHHVAVADRPLHETTEEYVRTSPRRE